MTGPVLEARGVSRRYGSALAVDRADLSLTPGRLTGLLGPSGSGKSTLLRLLAGLEPVDAGEVRAGDALLSAPGRHVPPERRDLGLVFQDYALFPHLTVADNVAFGLRAPRAERRARALDLLREVRLDSRTDAYPQALSGGEQQRVALVRALARKPRAVLLDEPFSGLDGALKAEVRDATLAALRAAGAAVLIVTHDAEEALMTADDLALMQDGRILQAGEPRQVYAQPVSLAAARLLGEIDTFPAHVRDGQASTPFGPLPAPGRADGPALAAARPEAFRLGDDGAPVQVRETRFAGSSVAATLVAGEARAVARFHPADAPTTGETVRVRLDPRFCVLF